MECFNFQIPHHSLYLLDTFSIFAEERQPLDKLDIKGKNLLSDQTLDMFTTFYLKISFTGEYEEGCGLSFSIMDPEEMFFLDLRLNDDCYDKYLIQNSRFHGKWKFSGNKIDLPDLGKVNEIYVLVASNFYEVVVNNVKVSPKVKVDLDRLMKFKGVSIDERGSCIKVDLERSYMMKG